MQYIHRNTHENYTALNNAFLQDKRIKATTIGILAVILSNKPDWVVYPEEIAQRLEMSRTTVDKHFKILEECGYLLVIKESLGRKKGTRTHRHFTDVPFSDTYIDYLKERHKKLSTD